MRRGGCASLDAWLHGGCTRSSVGPRQMEISILGSLEAREGTRILDLGGGKQRALLANLAIHRGQLLGPDRLIDDLWGDRPPPSAAKTLQVLISRLRKTLGRETIVRRGGEDTPGLDLAPSEDTRPRDDREARRRLHARRRRRRHRCPAARGPVADC